MVLEGVVTADRINDLKHILLSDFRDAKYPHCTIIDIYIRDKDYYKSLIVKNSLDKNVVAFFEKCALEIDNAVKNIPTEGFRHLKYENIIQDYVDGKPSIKNKSGLKEKNRTNNGTKIQKGKPYNKKRNANNGDIVGGNNKKKRVIIVTAPGCQGLTPKRIKEIKRKNEEKENELRERKAAEEAILKQIEDEKRDKNSDKTNVDRIKEKVDNIDPALFSPDNCIPYEKCIAVIGEKKSMGCCFKCNHSLSVREYRFLSKKGRLITEHIKVCEVCEISYLSDALYIRKKSNLSFLGYYYAKTKEFSKTKIQKLSKIEEKWNAFQIFKESYMRVPEVSQESVKEKRKKEALARIEKAQNKRVELENARRINIEKEKGIYRLPKDANPIEYEVIKNVCVFVYERLYNRCARNHGDEIRTYTALVPTVKDDRDLHPINIYYCPKCDRYFVNAEAVADYVKRGIYLKLHYDTTYTGADMRSISELRLYGYTVRAGVMTEAQRQGLLKFIIDSKLMKKHEIIRQLRWYIDYLGKNPNNESAVDKWYNDLYFVQTYVDDNDKDLFVDGNYVRKR